MTEYNPYGTRINISDRKAKKQYKCSLCKNIIEIDEIYTYVTQIKPCRHYLKFLNFRLCLMHDINNIKIENHKIYEVNDE